MSEPEAGHRLVSRNADCTIEAWGPDRVSCLREALTGLVEEFAEVTLTPAAKSLPLGAEAAEPAEMLLSLLEDVIHAVEVFWVVPVCFHLAEADDGGIAGDMEVVPASQARLSGPVPKGVSYHGLSMAEDGRGWRCRVLVDV